MDEPTTTSPTAAGSSETSTSGSLNRVENNSQPRLEPDEIGAREGDSSGDVRQPDGNESSPGGEASNDSLKLPEDTREPNRSSDAEAKKNEITKSARVEPSQIESSDVGPSKDDEPVVTINKLKSPASNAESLNRSREGLEGSQRPGGKTNVKIGSKSSMGLADFGATKLGRFESLYSDDDNDNEMEELVENAQVESAAETVPYSHSDPFQDKQIFKTDPRSDVPGSSFKMFNVEQQDAKKPDQGESRMIPKVEPHSRNPNEGGAIQIINPTTLAPIKQEPRSKSVVDKPSPVSLQARSSKLAALPNQKPFRIVQKTARPSHHKPENSGRHSSVPRLFNKPQFKATKVTKPILITRLSPKQLSSEWVRSGKAPDGKNVYVLQKSAGVASKAAVQIPAPRTLTAPINPEAVGAWKTKPVGDISSIKISDVRTVTNESNSEGSSPSQSLSSEVKNLSDFSPSTFKCKVKLEELSPEVVKARLARKRKQLFSNFVEDVNDDNDADWRPEEDEHVPKKHKSFQPRSEKAGFNESESPPVEATNSPAGLDFNTTAQTRNLIGNNYFENP